MDMNANNSQNGKTTPSFRGEETSLEECKEKLAMFHHRNVQLQTAVDISRILSSILDPEELLPQFVELIRQRFDLYYVGLFLVDQSGEWNGEPGSWAFLRAATGLAGKRMIAEGYKLKVDNASSVGRCILHHQSQIIDAGEGNDSDTSPFDNPLLPETRSELVVPLLTRGQAIGAITLQSDRASAFDTEQSTIIQTLADQLSNAITNTHLYEQLQRELNDRKRTEQALQESGERLSTLLNAIPAGVVVIDPQTHTIVDANQAAIDMIKAGSPEKVIGAVCHTFICPSEEGQCPITDLHQSIDHSERILLTALGEEIPIIKIVSPVIIDGREHLMETFLDVRKRKQTEEDLRRVNRNLIVLVRLSQKFATSLDLQQTSQYLLSETVELTDAAGALLWMVEDETKELICQTVFPPDLPTQTLPLHLPIEQESIVGWVAKTDESALVPVAQEDLRFAGEKELPANLHTASLLVVPLRAQEQVIGVLEIIAQPGNEFQTDDLILVETIGTSAGLAISNARLYSQAQQEIAERRQAEEALRRSEEQYRYLVENANEGIGVIQGDRFQLINPYLTNITGYTEEEILSLPFVTYIHPDDREMVIQRYTARLQGLEVPDQYEFRIIRRDGQTRWVEMKAVLIKWKYEPATLIFLSDITDRKFTEIALERAHEELAIYTDHLERRTAQLQVGAEVAREAATIRDVQQLLNTAVRLISERFGFYHAGIFLIDEQGQYAILRAASSEGGQRMLARRHKLEVGKTGIVGHVAATGEPRIALDVGTDAVHFANPDLPDTRSEMGLPLKIHGTVIGVLDVQDVHEAAFSEDDIAILQTLADQLAVAIDNARLLQRNEIQIRELEMLYGEYSTRAWYSLTTTDRPQAYLYDRIDVMPTESIPVPGIDQALTRGETVAMVAPETEERALITPLKLHNRVIGTLGVLEQDGGRHWSPSEVALIEAVGEQVALALEDAQHFAETQRSAQQMRVLNELGQSLTTHLNIQEVIEETYQGTSRLLDTSNFYVALYDPEKEIVSFPLAIEHGQPVKWNSRQMGNGLTEYIIRTQEPLLIRGNMEEELTKRGIDAIGTVSLSWMGTPMIVANQVLGIIAVQNYTTPNAYDQRDLDLLSAIASQTAIALQNARLFEQVQRQAQREHQIYEITSRIRRSPDIKHILKTTVSELAQALQVDRAIVRLTTKEELQEQKGDGDGYSPDPTTATETERKTGEEQ